VCVGVSYRTAAVDFRERLSALEFHGLEHLRAACPSIQEWALVTTCNRWELYAATTESAETALAEIRAALQAAVNLSAGEFAPLLFCYGGREAARHLCHVASGLDSIILGESQVQGQVSGAFAAGLEQGSVGPVLSALMRTAIRTGRRARQETPISARAVTMSSVALAAAEARAGDLADRRIVVVGAGEMVRLALHALRSRRVRQVIIANRTLAHAQALLLDASWQAVTLNDLPVAVAQADIVFCATRAPGFVLSPEILVQPPNAPMQGKVLIDLALPRDVDPSFRRVPGMTLIDLDDLQGQLDQGLATRRQAIPAVEALIEAALDEWEQAMRDLSVRPLLVELRLKAEQIRRQEMARTLRFLGDVDDSTRAHLDYLTRALVNKLLHEPTMHIKSLAHDDQVDAHAAAVRAMFGLDPTITSPQGTPLDAE
jgi:glutamyl-tRNA reductase